MARIVPVSSAMGMNSEGGMTPLVGCLHLTKASTPDSSTAQPDQGLVLKEEFISFDGMSEVFLHFQPLLRSPTHSGVKDCALRFSVFLGGVHRKVCAPEEIGRGAGALTRHSHANARSLRGVMSSEEDRRQECRPYAIGQLKRFTFARHSIEKDRELVASETGQNIAWPQSQPQSLRNRD